MVSEKTAVVIPYCQRRLYRNKCNKNISQTVTIVTPLLELTSECIFLSKKKNYPLVLDAWSVDEDNLFILVTINNIS